MPPAGEETASAPHPLRSKTFAIDLLCIIFLSAACLSIGLPRYRAGMVLKDEGILAYGAERVMQGQIPNRDFVSVQPPLSFYTAAAMFRLFGTSLGSLRILGISIYLLIVLFVYGIARNVTCPPLSLAAAVPALALGIPYFYFIPFAVWQGITASLAAAFLFLRASLGRHHALALPAGIMTAVSILLRHDQALYLAISILVFLLGLKYTKGAPTCARNLRRLLALWGIGIATVILPFGLYWWAQGAWPKMIAQLITFPLTTYAKTSSLPFPRFSLETTFSENAIIVLYYLPPTVEALVGIWLLVRVLHRQFHLREAVIAFLFLWSALFYCQVLNRSDLYHLLITLAPFFLLAACCWGVFREKLDKITGNLWQNGYWLKTSAASANTIAGVVLILFLWTISRVCLPDVRKESEAPTLERAGIRVEGAQRLSDFIRTVQSYAPPDRSILCLPYDPILYFLCERRNPTHWNYLWPGDQTPEDHQLLIHQATSDPPAVVLIEREAEMRSYAPAIIEYVHTGYRFAGNWGYIAVYLPR